jgi:hypothetical protein
MNETETIKMTIAFAIEDPCGEDEMALAGAVLDFACEVPKCSRLQMAKFLRQYRIVITPLGAVHAVKRDQTES